MIDYIVGPFEYSFMVRALIVSVVVGVMCPVLGAYVITRGRAFMGDALAHSVLPGMVVAFLLGISPFFAAVPTGIALALLMGAVARRTGISEDTSIGVVFAGMFALGLVMLSKSTNINVNIEDLLLGQVLGVLQTEVYVSLGLAAVVLVGLAVGLTLGPPVFFRQQRVGLGNKPFTVLKFRTMTSERGANGRPLPDRERLTRLGKLLRRFSLDELPQLWNVLKGDMSLVGPRPLVTDYMTRYTPSQKRRHDVRPGITGWAQVHGRNDISWERKFELDAWYLMHASPRLDLRILASTVWQAVRSVGRGREGAMSAPEFLGRAESISE